MLEYTKIVNKLDDLLIVAYILNVFQKYFTRNLCSYTLLIQNSNLKFKIEFSFNFFKFVSCSLINRKKSNICVINEISVY